MRLISRKYLIVSVICISLIVIGLSLKPAVCSAGSDSEVAGAVDEFSEYDEPAVVNDPLEGLNRSFFTFNLNLHNWLVEPTAKAYRKVTPSVFRIGVLNFFNNLLEPTRFFNSLLQGRFIEARETGLRFLLNSTAGVAGLMDPATHDGMNIHERRFSSTLAFYGVGSGPYLVIPFYGPSDVRGVGGFVGDTLASPLWYAFNGEPLVVVLVKASKTVNQTSFRLGEYKKMISGALDPYIAVRNAFVQHQHDFIESTE
jgi:phospholipid-binding lipoprotein MlaA